MIKRNRFILLAVLFIAGTYFFYSFLIFRSFTVRYFLHIQWHLVFIGVIDMVYKMAFIFLQWKLLSSLTKKHEYLKLVVISIILLTVCFALEYFTRKFFYPRFVGFQIRQFPVWAFNLAQYFICLFAVLSVFYIKAWKRSEKQKRELIEHQLTSELIFLKQQINPHFLFNTLSSLFSYAQKYNSVELQNGLLKFSDFLRYSIYDTSVRLIALSKEIKYINDYIELIKLRFVQDEIVVNCKVDGNIGNVYISPMIILPFIENAFKYGAYAEEHSVVNISFKIEQHFLTFKCDNRVFEDTGKVKDDYKGVGIKNVKRRLEIIYPGQHSLQISEHDNRFFVELKLNTENEMHHH